MSMAFKTKELVFEKNKELRWPGHLLFKGLFDDKHIFELKDSGNGATTSYQSEIFTDILVSLFAKQLDNSTRRGFVLVNEKLKEMAEP